MLQLVEHAILLKLIMEKLDINYSMKNIPIQYSESYLIKLIEKIESVVKRMRWRDHFMTVIFGEKTPGLNQKALHHNANIWQHLKRNSRHDTKHQISICKRYISEEVNRGHYSKNKTVTKFFAFADKRSNIYEMPKQYHKKLHIKSTCKKHQLN